MRCDLPRRGYLWNYAELISDCAGSCTGFTVQTFLKPDRKVVVDGGHCSCTCMVIILLYYSKLVILAKFDLKNYCLFFPKSRGESKVKNSSGAAMMVASLLQK